MAASMEAPSTGPRSTRSRGIAFGDRVHRFVDRALRQGDGPDGVRAVCGDRRGDIRPIGDRVGVRRERGKCHDHRAHCNACLHEKPLFKEPGVFNRPLD